MHHVLLSTLIALGLTVSAIGTVSAQPSGESPSASQVIVAQAGGQGTEGQNSGGQSTVPTAVPSGGGTQSGSQMSGQSGGGGPSGVAPASGDTPATNVRGTGPTPGDAPVLLAALAMLAVAGGLTLYMLSRRRTANRSTVEARRRE